MKSFWQVAVLCVLACSLTAPVMLAQDKFDAFSLESEFIPAANFDDAPAGTFLEDVEVEQYKTDVAFRYAFPFNNNETVIVPELSIRYLHLSYDNWDTSVTPEPAEDLYNFRIGLAFVHKLNQNWTLLSAAQMSLDTDLEDISSQSFGGTFGFRFDWRKDDRLTLGFGLGVKKTFGQPLPLPLLRLAYTNQSWFRADVLLPQHAELWFQPAEAVELGLALRADGEQYHVENTSNLDDNDIQYMTIYGGIAVSIEAAENFYITGFLGSTLLRRFTTYDGDDKQDDFDLENTFFARIGISYSIG